MVKFIGCGSGEPHVRTTGACNCHLAHVRCGCDVPQFSIRRCIQYLIVIRRTHETCRRGRRPDVGIVAPGRTSDFFPRARRAVVPRRALEASVLLFGRGCGRGRGADTDVSSGAGDADESVGIGSVGAGWTLFWQGWIGSYITPR